MRLRRWLPVGIAIVAAALCTAWLAREHAIPGWDQALYLDVSARYGHAMGSGPLHFATTVWSARAGHGPVLPLALAPFVAIFGASVAGALVLHVLLWPVLVLATGAIAAELFGGRARLPAMLAILAMPLVIGLSHAVF